MVPFTTTVDMEMLEKTSKAISTIAILWPVKAIFETRAATVEVETFIFPEGPGLKCSSENETFIQQVHRETRYDTSICMLPQGGKVQGLGHGWQCECYHTKEIKRQKHK